MRLKRLLPPSLHRAQKRARVYWRRLKLWRHVLVEVRGESPLDSGKLVLSALASPVTAFGDLLRWRDPQLLFDTDVRVPGRGRFRLRRRSDDLWHVMPGRERRIGEALRALLREGDVFVDAGANIGCYAVEAAGLVGPAGSVVAVEMIPETAARLRLHVERNRLANVRVIEAALAERAGETLTATVPDGRFGQARLGEGRGRVVHVTTTTLDAAATAPRVRLLKLDLEGAEAPALRGARALLARTDAVVFERLEGADDAAVEALLTGAGFRLHPLDKTNRLAVRPGVEGVAEGLRP